MAKLQNQVALITGSDSATGRLLGSPKAAQIMPAII